MTVPSASAFLLWQSGIISERCSLSSKEPPSFDWPRPRIPAEAHLHHARSHRCPLGHVPRSRRACPKQVRLRTARCSSGPDGCWSCPRGTLVADVSGQATRGVKRATTSRCLAPERPRDLDPSKRRELSYIRFALGTTIARGESTTCRGGKAEGSPEACLTSGLRLLRRNSVFSHICFRRLPELAFPKREAFIGKGFAAFIDLLKWLEIG